MLHAKIEPLEWENRFFSCNSAQLIWHEDSSLDPIRLDEFELVQAKVNSQEKEKLYALQRLGFFLVEGEVDFQLTVKTIKKQVGISVASLEHIPVLKILASEAFIFSRFCPPWYLPNDRARFYAQWIEKAVYGAFDDQCLIAHDKYNKLQGFVSLRKIGDDSARIGLLFSLPKERGRGVGTRLILSAINWSREKGLTKLYAATQLSNLTALHFYVRCGAIINDISYWLYRQYYDCI